MFDLASALFLVLNLDFTADTFWEQDRDGGLAFRRLKPDIVEGLKLGV